MSVDLYKYGKGKAVPIAEKADYRQQAEEMTSQFFENHEYYDGTEVLLSVSLKVPSSKDFYLTLKSQLIPLNQSSEQVRLFDAFLDQDTEEFKIAAKPDVLAAVRDELQELASRKRVSKEDIKIEEKSFNEYQIGEHEKLLMQIEAKQKIFEATALLEAADGPDSKSLFAKLQRYAEQYINKREKDEGMDAAKAKTIASPHPLAESDPATVNRYPEVGPEIHIG